MKKRCRLPSNLNPVNLALLFFLITPFAAIVVYLLDFCGFPAFHQAGHGEYQAAHLAPCEIGVLGTISLLAALPIAARLRFAPKISVVAGVALTVGGTIVGGLNISPGLARELNHPAWSGSFILSTVQAAQRPRRRSR